MTKFNPKIIPEGINSTPENPLVDFLKLIAQLIPMVLIVYFLLDWGTRWAFSFISLKQEVQMGTYILKKNELKDGNKNAPMHSLVDALWLPFKNQDSPAPHGLVIEEAYANAFMAPGGILQVTTTLVNQSKSENELSFVVCHELGHYFHRHALTRLSRSLVLGLISALLGLGSDNGALNLGIELGELTYSREQESEADRFALSCLNSKYGHIQEFDTFFKKAAQAEGLTNLKVLQYVSTHPIPENRIDELIALGRNNNFKFHGDLKQHNLK